VSIAKQPDYLTTADVAAHYRVGIANVLSWIHSGALPALDTSRGTQRPRYRIRRADLEVFEHRRTTKRKSPTPRRQAKKDVAVIEFF
jgi:hypothetical protein